MSPDPDHQHPRDFTFACVVGPLPWWQGSARSPTATVATLSWFAALLVLSGSMLVGRPLRRVDPTFDLEEQLLLGGALVGLLALGETLLMFRQHVHRQTLRMLVTRGIGVGLIALAGAQLSPIEVAFVAVPLGGLAGVEATLTSVAIGRTHTDGRSILRFLVSPVHLGLVGAMAAAIVVARDHTLEVVLSLFIGLELVVASAGTAFFLTRRLFAIEQDMLRSLATSDQRAERRRLAHWIHDDVCGDIRGIRLKLAAGALAPDRLVGALDELDHRLRLRQLDEVLAGGEATAADVIQPYVRRAQSLGLSVLDVPRLEEASIVLPGPTAENFRRAVAGLVSNAINAGATSVALRLRKQADLLILEIEDDAGGFDLVEAPGGRGLDALRRDLGAERVVHRATDRGTLASVTFQVGPG